MKKGIIGATIAFLLFGFASAPADAEALPSYGTKDSRPLDAPLFDLLILRPMGLAACAVGLAASIVALPFAAASHSGDQVREKFIVEPFEYTFKRPLGETY